MRTKEFDVVVIGAGLGGLSCAAFLAKQGLRVAVFEQHYQAGGYCHSFRRGPYTFDAAIEYIGCCGKEQDVWNALSLLGAERYVTFAEMDPDGFDQCYFPRHKVAVCKDLDRYRERLVALFPRERQGLVTYFSTLTKIWEEFHAGRVGMFMWKLKRFPSVCPTLRRSVGKTLADLLDSTISSKPLRAILAAQSGDYALPPSQVDLIVHATTVMHFHQGAYYPHGGVQSLPDGIVKALTLHGGQLTLRQGVRRIQLNGDRVEGVELENGECVRARVVISNADPKRTLLELLDGNAQAPRWVSRLRKAQYSLSSFQVYVGAKLDLEGLGLKAANYWLCPSYDFEKVYQFLFQGGIPRKRAYVLVTSPSLKDPSKKLAPPGSHVLKIVTPIAHERFANWEQTHLGRRGAAYKAFKDRFADILLDQASELIPGLKGRIECRVVGTPLTNIAYTKAPQGAMYGFARTPQQSGPLGLSPRTGIRGLYLTGTSVYYPGVIGALASGIMSGALVLEDSQRLRLFKRSYYLASNWMETRQ